MTEELDIRKYIKKHPAKISKKKIQKLINWFKKIIAIQFFLSDENERDLIRTEMDFFSMLPDNSHMTNRWYALKLAELLHISDMMKKDIKMTKKQRINFAKNYILNKSSIKVLFLGD